MWPALRDRGHTFARFVSGPGATDSITAPSVLILERGDGHELLAAINLSPQTLPFPQLELAGRKKILSTEDARYGGDRKADQDLERLFPYELLVLGRS